MYCFTINVTHAKIRLHLCVSYGYANDTAKNEDTLIRFSILFLVDFAFIIKERQNNPILNRV